MHNDYAFIFGHIISKYHPKYGLNNGKMVQLDNVCTIPSKTKLKFIHFWNFFITLSSAGLFWCCFISKNVQSRR